jgi:glycosyltransferase involved in cell wall biosynthesis
LSTYGEGISNAILEYFVFSKPVIATDVPGNSEIIMSGKNGYLVEVGSAEALAEKIVVLFKNPSLANQMGMFGKTMVTKMFGLQIMVDSFESVYLSLTEKLKN